MRTFYNLADGSKAAIIDNEKGKFLISENYNYLFNKKDGLFIRFGKNPETDAPLDLGLPEIADIEISTICSGVNGVCKFCYKSNTPKGSYMSIETFKKLFDKLPASITQIAVGAGTINFEGTETMFQIMEYCRENGVIPNITITGYELTPKIAERFSKVCGAIAVSKIAGDKNKKIKLKKPRN